MEVRVLRNREVRVKQSGQLDLVYIVTKTPRNCSYEESKENTFLWKVEASFAPLGDSLQATNKHNISNGLEKWLHPIIDNI
jgi:hypothetical protein